MNFADAKEWLLFGFSVLTSAFSAGVIWTKLNGKIDQNAEELKKKASVDQLNGMSGRIESVKQDCATYNGSMTEFRRELSEYRQEARESTSILNRVEQSNLEIASRVAELNKSIVAMDKATSNRLIQLETLTRIEKKVGPIPTD